MPDDLSDVNLDNSAAAIAAIQKDAAAFQAQLDGLKATLEGREETRKETRVPEPVPIPRRSTQPNALATNGINPTIHLAEQDWPIPLLSVRQNRLVGPSVSTVMRRMREIAEIKVKELTDSKRKELLAAVAVNELRTLGTDGALRKRVWETIDWALEVVDIEFFDAFATAIYWALTKAHPNLSREEFDGMPIGMLDMVRAIGTVALQSGMMRPAAPDEPRPLAG